MTTTWQNKTALFDASTGQFFVLSGGNLKNVDF
jgi:hypothetical protein